MVIDSTDENGDLRGVVAIGASAGGVKAITRLAAGLFRHYSAVAAETERALVVLSERLSANGPGHGDPGG